MKFLGLFNKNKKETKKNHQTKVSKTLVIDSKYGTAHWPDRDYLNFAKDSYMKNVISFRCIFYIASSLASVDWGLYKKSDTERIQITDHPIVNILKRANPDTSFTFLIQRLISFFLITGNAYIERVTVANGEIRELYALRPDKITIKTNKDTGVITEYVYDQKLNFPVDPITKKSDILQIKSFHPLDDFYGLSITEPISREIDSSNEATEWQKKVFENEGRPGMAVFVHGFLTDAQWDRLEKQLNDKYRGSKNAGKTIVIEGESTGDMKPYSWTPKEMDWIESNRELSRKICNGYGVPPMLLGIPKDNTYNNMKEARAGFWEETIIYYLNLFKGEINNWIFETDEIFIDYDLNKIPALEYKKELMWKRVENADFLTIDEKREMVGKEKLPNGMGDVILVNMGSTTLDQLLADNEELDSMLDGEEQQDEEDKEIQKLVDEGYSDDMARIIVGERYE
jgi:HK97 family phage portal protein